MRESVEQNGADHKSVDASNSLHSPFDGSTASTEAFYMNYMLFIVERLSLMTPSHNSARFNPRHSLVAEQSWAEGRNLNHCKLSTIQHLENLKHCVSAKTDNVFFVQNQLLNQLKTWRNAEPSRMYPLASQNGSGEDHSFSFQKRSKPETDSRQRKQFGSPDNTLKYMYEGGESLFGHNCFGDYQFTTEVN